MNIFQLQLEEKQFIKNVKIISVIVSDVLRQIIAQNVK